MLVRGPLWLRRSHVVYDVPGSKYRCISFRRPPQKGSRNISTSKFYMQSVVSGTTLNMRHETFYFALLAAFIGPTQGPPASGVGSADKEA